MKLINQSYEICNQTDFSLLDIYKHIEKCARAGLAASSICLMSRDTVSKEISEDNILKLLKNTEVM